VQVLKQYFLFSTVTAIITELLCSHARSVFIYTEALASNCTLWGVKPNGTDLSERYDTKKVKVDGRCIVPDIEGKVP